jgi:Bacterial PH domain
MNRQVIAREFSDPADGSASETGWPEHGGWSYDVGAKLSSPSAKPLYTGPAMSPDTTPNSTAPSRAHDVLPAETVLWEGAPSQWQNFWWWLSCLLIIGIPFAFVKWLQVKNKEIRLTSERLQLREGILSKQTEEIELYRVRDWTFEEPLLQRMLGKGSFLLETSDRTAPEVRLDWIPDARAFGDLLRSAVERMRVVKRVREVEVD